jgi:membrane-associated phospholipid phosphatase
VAWLRGYKYWPWIYTIGFACTVTMTYFRISSDMHWATDTLVGAAIGTGLGIRIPWLHGVSSRQKTLRVVLRRDGLVIAGEF